MVGPMTATVETSVRITPLDPVALGPETLGYPADNRASIPPPADQRERLDFREILPRPVAFLSIGQWIGFAVFRDAYPKTDFDKALQTAFVGTDLPGPLSRQRVEVAVLTGIHLDWYVEWVGR